MNHHYCFSCGREIQQSHRAVAILVIQVHKNRVGQGRLHSDCCSTPSLVKYPQTITWECTMGNAVALRTLHNRLADINESQGGSVPLFAA
jgi:hypothetical protein